MRYDLGNVRVVAKFDGTIEQTTQKIGSAGFL